MDVHCIIVCTSYTEIHYIDIDIISLDSTNTYMCMCVCNVYHRFICDIRSGYHTDGSHIMR